MLRTIPLFGTGSGNRAPVVTAQKRTNLYCAPSKDPEKGSFYLACTPGLTSKVASASLGGTPSRGAFAIGNKIYTVHDNDLYEIDNIYTVTDRGTLNTTSGPVSFAWNGTQLMMVDGTDGWIFKPSDNSFTEITDADFPSSPKTVTFLAGRFIVNKGSTGQFYWSALLDGLSWDALDFATAESETDNLVAVASDHGSLVLLGDITTEFWAANPNAADSTESFIRLGGSGIEWGCAAIQTIVKYDTGLCWLAKNQLGECRVVKLQGYTAIPLDDPETSNIINGQTSLSAATAFSYVMDGQSFYQLNVGSISLLFDGIGWGYVSTGVAGGRHLGNIRASLTTEPYVFSYTDGEMYLLDKDVLTDDETANAREVISRHIHVDGNPVTIWRVVMDCEVGVSPDNDESSMSLYVSKDAGKTFGSAYDAELGALLDYGTRVVWRRLGRARDWVFKFRTEDQVRVTITGASAELES
jgi:hypothetical protein